MALRQPAPVASGAGLAGRLVQSGGSSDVAHESESPLQHVGRLAGGALHGGRLPEWCRDCACRILGHAGPFNHRVFDWVRAAEAGRQPNLTGLAMLKGLKGLSARAA